MTRYSLTTQNTSKIEERKLQCTLHDFMFLTICVCKVLPGAQEDEDDADEHDGHCRQCHLQEVVGPDLQVGHGVLLLVVDELVPV